MKRKRIILGIANITLSILVIVVGLLVVVEAKNYLIKKNRADNRPVSSTEETTTDDSSSSDVTALLPLTGSENEEKDAGSFAGTLLGGSIFDLEALCAVYNLTITSSEGMDSIDTSMQSIAMSNNYVTNDEFDHGVPRHIDPSAYIEEGVATIFFDANGNCYNGEGNLTTEVILDTADTIIAVPGGYLTVSYYANGTFEIKEPVSEEYKTWADSDDGKGFLNALSGLH